MPWEPLVFRAPDGTEILVEFTQSQVPHVALRERYGVWGLPLECVEDTRLRSVQTTDTMCPQCGERPIISTRHNQCATCIMARSEWVVV